MMPHSAHRFWMMAVMLAGLTGCALETPLPSTGYLPPDSFSQTRVGEDPAIAATNAATDAFAHPGAMRGHPAQMALAIAALDAMAGQFTSGARWAGMNSLAKQEMILARQRVRRLLGVAPGTSSQMVVNALVGASQQLQRGNRAGVLEALGSPGFTQPPEATLVLLADFPPVPLANHATMFASQYLYPGGSGVFPAFR
jgi:hypothetical protein